MKTEGWIRKKCRSKLKTESACDRAAAAAVTGPGSWKFFIAGADAG